MIFSSRTQSIILQSILVSNMAVFIDTMKEQKKGMGLLNLTDVQIFLILFLELTNLIDSNTYFRVYLCLFIQCSLMRVLWLRSCFGLVLLRSVFRLPRTQVCSDYVAGTESLPCDLHISISSLLVLWTDRFCSL